MTPSTSSSGHAGEEPEVSPNREDSAFLGSERTPSPLSGEREEQDHEREVLSWKKLPWWKRPSPYWLIFGTFFSSTGFSALLAPKVALYTTLACRVHRPEYDSSFAFPSTHNLMSTTTADLVISDTNGTAVEAITALLSAYTSSSYHTQYESDLEQKCASDPVVQAVVARLNAVFNTSMGIISCLTAGWWGSLSDRHGRRIVLFASTFGLFVTEFTHIITAWFMDVLPGGYWFPLAGFLFEGLCGSMPSGVALTHTYLADTTDPSTRSRYFSLFLGFMFIGVAVGPALGGLLIRSTGTVLSAFYFACVLHGVSTIFVLLVLPESLTRARKWGARLRRTQEKVIQVSGGRALDGLKSVGRFLSPLVVLLPKRSSDANPLKPRGRDWSLFFIALAYGLVTSTMGSLPYKFQYAASQFNWTPEITSYYVSVTGAARAFFLAVILPLIIKYFKPAPLQLLSTPDEPLQGTVGSSSDGASPAQTNLRLLASSSSAFDLALARTSVGLETTMFLGMAIASTGTLFAVASVIGSFAAGFSPATQALALEIYANRSSQNRGEVGKLFGALSVVQALGTQIISPALYGFVYFNTVAKLPQAIMVVSVCTSLLAFTFLSLVRIRQKSVHGDIPPEHGNEDGNQDTLAPEILLATEIEIIEGR